MRVQLVQLSNNGCLGVEGPEQGPNLAIYTPKGEIPACFHGRSRARFARFRQPDPLESAKRRPTSGLSANKPRWPVIAYAIPSRRGHPRSNTFLRLRELRNSPYSWPSPYWLPDTRNWKIGRQSFWKTKMRQRQEAHPSQVGA